MKKLNHLWHFSIAAEGLRYIYSTIQLVLSFGGVNENFDVEEKRLNMVSMTITT